MISAFPLGISDCPDIGVISTSREAFFRGLEEKPHLPSFARPTYCPLNRIENLERLDQSQIDTFKMRSDFAVEGARKLLC